MAFGIGSTSLLVGTAAVGIVSILPNLGFGGGFYRTLLWVSYLLPLLLAAEGVRHGVTAFVLAKRGIPCHKESEFAAFLGIVISLLVAGIFLWYGVYGLIRVPPPPPGFR